MDKFCQIHSFLLKTISKMSHTCNMKNLHSYWPLLTNSTEEIFQSGIIDCGISDHQLIFCTRKVERVKFHQHNNVLLRSPKHYTVNLFVEGLRKVIFLNYERFSNIDAEYTDILNKLMRIINEIAPSKKIKLRTTMKTGLIEKLLIWFMFGKIFF